MQDAKVINQAEVREILAEYFCVPKESIISSKYSFIIMGYNESINSKFKEDNQNEIVCGTGK